MKREVLEAAVCGTKCAVISLQDSLLSLLRTAIEGKKSVNAKEAVPRRRVCDTRVTQAIREERRDADPRKMKRNV